MVTCQGTHAAVAICLAVADVEKVNAQNFVFVPRFSFALAILLLLLASCCKMSSTYRPPSVTTALLDSCSASNNWPVYFPLLLALPEWKNFKKLLRYCPVSRIWFIARKSFIIPLHNIRLKWTKEMANSDHSPRWQFLLLNKCREWISQFRHQLDTHRHQHMGNPTATHHHRTKVTHQLLILHLQVLILHRATPLLVTPGDVSVTLVGVQTRS
ncbi:hypothetical protein RHGRI_019061 [Rhododendron griersonianum]|uniref:Uncharacterized protein n=1 Tax=Rhododendron griersonianum TaxID=479676 RepID=A0AAV6JD97_9ERIC|nr:hypothetical protein RHGRI_019061 [Rhododendron griersonianum]